MLKPIKTLLKDNIIFIAILITISIVYLSLIKLPKSNLHFGHLDKWQHSIAYFSLTLSWLLTYYKKSNKKYLILFFCFIFGIIIEILQSTITTYRTGDYLDVIANSVGILLGLVFFNLISKKNLVN